MMDSNIYDDKGHFRVSDIYIKAWAEEALLKIAKAKIADMSEDELLSIVNESGKR